MKTPTDDGRQARRGAVRQGRSSARSPRSPARPLARPGIAGISRRRAIPQEVRARRVRDNVIWACLAVILACGRDARDLVPRARTNAVQARHDPPVQPPRARCAVGGQVSLRAVARDRARRVRARWRSARHGPRRHRADGRASRAAGKLDPARILAIEATTRHDVIAFLTHVEELAGEPARWLHLGMTSSRRARHRARAPDRARARPDRRTASTGLGARARREGARAREDADDRPLARHPRRADHRGPGVRALVRRGRARVERASSARAHAIAVGKIAGAVGVYGNLDPQIEREALGELGLDARDRRHADRRARSPRRRAQRARDARHRDRADRARRPPLAAHRGRRGRGGVRRRGRRAPPRCRTRRTRSSART